jgi:uncharacterized membrane protein
MPNSPPLSKARLEALTDGIFAVAMTLLVLDLKLDEAVDGPSLAEEFLRLVDHVDNYAISFAVLAVFWIGHLRIIRRVHEADSFFVVANLALLFLTTLVPPLTALLGHHPEQPRAALLDGGNLILILTCEMLLWHRVCTGLANETLEDPEATWRRLRWRYQGAIGVVLLGIVAALVEIALGSAKGFAAWIYLLLIGLGVMRPPLSSRR